MSGFQKLSDLAPITMTMLSNPRKKDETEEEYIERICEILKGKKE